MSVFLDIADDIKTAIESVITPDEAVVVVDRQTDMNAEFKKHINKVKGGFIGIEFISGPSADEHSHPPAFNGKYVITLVGHHILRKGKSPLDDLLEKVCTKLQHWRGESEPLCYSEAKVTNVKTIESPNTLIYQINLEKKLQLPTT